MTAAGDPYRTLGLPPGASIGEVKRAYRRLAKQYHPDSAGEGALPRFLAIQAAYEMLIGPSRSRPGGGRAGAGGRRSWEAEPDRTRATWEAYRRRANQAGARPGAGDGATDQAPGADGDGQTDAGKARAERGRADAGAREGGTDTGRSRDESGRGRSEPGRGRDRTRRAETERDHERRRATLGSTSYDDAEEETAARDWEGATWYGTTSGTYWTINPKEYADPRKHGPEYQSRARRRSRVGGEHGGHGSADGGDPGDERAEATEAEATEVEATEAEATEAETAGTAQAPPRRGRRDGATDERAGAGATSTEATSAGAAPAQATATDAGAASASWSTAFGDPSANPGAAESIGRSDQPASLPTQRVRRVLGDRLGLALIGWPPIGIALAGLLGEATGCDRYAASCPDTLGVGTWLVQLAVIGVLVAVPALAALSASGSLAVLAAAVPATVLLGVLGAARTPGGGASGLLLGLLGVAYLAGVGLAATGRLELGTWSRSGPNRRLP